MTKLLIEYLRPNGQALRAVDLGTDFMELEGIPLANALRPFRDVAEGKLSKRGNVFFDFARCELPLPDGLDTLLRIRGTTVAMNEERLSEAGNRMRDGKAIVAINGSNYEAGALITKGRNPYWVKVYARKAARNSMFVPSREVVAVGNPGNHLEMVVRPIMSTTSTLCQSSLPFMSPSASSTHCPKCGSRLVQKQITLSSKVRFFMGCSAYPNCRFTRDV